MSIGWYLVVSALIFSMIGCGVPIGAISGNQPIAVNPGTVSPTVGTPGNSDTRSADATASGRIAPLLIAPAKAYGPSMMIWMCPPIMS